MTHSAIQMNYYQAADSEATSACFQYIWLFGTDALFYLTSNGYLRVKVLQQKITNTIAQNVVWFGVIDHTPDVLGVRVYYLLTDGSWWVLRYSQVGEQKLTPIQITSIGQIPKTFSIAWMAPRWIIVLDTGVQHYVYTALDDLFTIGVQNAVIYDNTLNKTLNVFFPRVSVSSSNVETITIAVDFTDSSNNSSGVATYVVCPPGFGLS
jgi:hypothetical protein